MEGDSKVTETIKRIADKHRLEVELVNNLATLFRSGLGDLSRRRNMHNNLKLYEVTVPNLRLVHGNPTLIGDLLDMAFASKSHRADAADPRERSFMRLPRGKQIEAGQEMIEQVIENAEKSQIS